MYYMKHFKKCFRGLHNVLFNISVTFSHYGGEMASTEIKKLWLHTELLPARKKGWNLI